MVRMSFRWGRELQPTIEYVESNQCTYGIEVDTIPKLDRLILKIFEHRQKASTCLTPHIESICFYLRGRWEHSAFFRWLMMVGLDGIVGRLMYLFPSEQSEYCGPQLSKAYGV